LKARIFHLDGHIYELEYNPLQEIKFKWQQIEGEWLRQDSLENSNAITI
jgi:hypothetical protein